MTIVIHYDMLLIFKYAVDIDRKSNLVDITQRFEYN